MAYGRALAAMVIGAEDADHADHGLVFPAQSAAIVLQLPPPCDVPEGRRVQQR
jgi:hypothetical protein